MERPPEMPIGGVQEPHGRDSSEPLRHFAALPDRRRSRAASGGAVEGDDRAELQRQHAVTWTGPAGTFRQATDLTKPLRDIYTALSIEPPKRILALEPAAPVS
jgi:hypothetical protein